MNAPMLIASLEKNAFFTFSRSGGPGGQNVNKVNTKALLTIDIYALEGLTSSEKERIIQRLANRLNELGQLSLFCDKERSQYRNREIALERAFSLLSFAAIPEKRRIPTKASTASKLRRLQKKQAHSTIKSLRKAPGHDD
jgi:ribosome-associated protein